MLRLTVVRIRHKNNLVRLRETLWFWVKIISYSVYMVKSPEFLFCPRHNYYWLRALSLPCKHMPFSWEITDAVVVLGRTLEYKKLTQLPALTLNVYKEYFKLFHQSTYDFVISNRKGSLVQCSNVFFFFFIWVSIMKCRENGMYCFSSNTAACELWIDHIVDQA